MSRLALALVAAIAFAPVCAQDRPFLTKAQTESLASGKKWIQTFPAGSEITWDLRDNHTVMTNYTAPVNRKVGVAHGTWSVDDEGTLCTAWTGSYSDRCVRVVKEDDKLKLVDPKNPTGTFALLTVE